MKSGRLVNRVFLLLAIPLLAYLTFATARKALEVYQLNQQASQIRSEIAVLKDRNTELRRQIEYHQSPDYVERAAREQLNLVQPGDIPLVLVYPSGKEPPAEPSRASTPTQPPSPAFWQRWWSFFFGEGG